MRSDSVGKAGTTLQALVAPTHLGKVREEVRDEKDLTQPELALLPSEVRLKHPSLRHPLEYTLRTVKKSQRAGTWPKALRKIIYQFHQGGSHFTA